MESTGIGRWLLLKIGMTKHSTAESHSIQPDESERAAESVERISVIVRQVMNDIGMLSSSYKFRVSPQSKNPIVFSIYIEMPLNFHTSTKRLTEVERRVASVALIRWGIVSNKVFWRVNDFQPSVVVKPTQLVSMFTSSIDRTNKSKVIKDDEPELLAKETDLALLRQILDSEAAGLVNHENDFKATEPFIK